MKSTKYDLQSEEMTFLKLLSRLENFGFTRTGLSYPETDANLTAHTTIREKARKRVAADISLPWRCFLAREVYNVWFGGWSSTEIADEGCFDVAQVGRHLKRGLSLDGLIWAMFHHERTHKPMPQPPNDFILRHAYAIGIGAFIHFFHQAGVPLRATELNPPEPWEMELYLRTSDGFLKAVQDNNHAAIQTHAADAVERTIDVLEAEACAQRIDTTDDPGLIRLRTLKESPVDAIAAVSRLVHNLLIPFRFTHDALYYQGL